MPHFDNTPRIFVSPVFRENDGWVWDWRLIGGDGTNRNYYDSRHSAWRDREATIAEFVGNNGPTLVVDVSPGMECFTPEPLPCPTINTYYTPSEHRERQAGLRSAEPCGGHLRLVAS